MSLTERDGRGLKAPQANTADTDPSPSHGEDEMNDEPARVRCDVVATLCRMSLLRNETLSVNGAYARAPPQFA